MSKLAITVLGEGAWGTALSTLLAHAGHTVTLWSHDAHTAELINSTHINERYMPGIKLLNSIHAVSNPSEAVRNAKIIFVAVPVQFLRHLLQQVIGAYCREQLWVMLCKGIEQDTLLLPTQMLDALFGKPVQSAVVMGPSFAKEVVNKQVTQVMVAAQNIDNATYIAQLLCTPFFKAEISDDILGVQISAALKNVYAVGMGILEGMACFSNTKALFLTRALQEMALIISACGGEQRTAYSLAGVGDLILTGTSISSKNFQFGMLIGQGKTIHEICINAAYVCEGIKTIDSIYYLIEKTHIKCPLLSVLHSVMRCGKKPSLILETLMY